MHTCTECGSQYEHADYGGEEGDIMRKEGVCFICAFWRRWVEMKGDPRVVRANGRHYCLGPDELATPARWKGFGGAGYTVRFHDGRVIVAHDLWSQGEIPAHFRERLPDNARLE